MVGDPDPDVFADLDPQRVGRARMLELSEMVTKHVSDRAYNWAIVAYPNEGWASTVFGEPDVDRLWDEVAKATRLYEDDPVRAWWDHMKTLNERARQMNEKGFEALRFAGGGTDLTVGLNPGSIWMSADFETSEGLRHVPNLPTEEIFTSPDLRPGVRLWLSFVSHAIVLPARGSFNDRWSYLPFFSFFAARFSFRLFLASFFSDLPPLSLEATAPPWSTSFPCHHRECAGPAEESSLGSLKSPAADPASTGGLAMELEEQGKDLPSDLARAARTVERAFRTRR
ncbi:MAG: aminopeptidase [Actinomycetota bacterium]